MIKIFTILLFIISIAPGQNYKALEVSNQELNSIKQIDQEIYNLITKEDQEKSEDIANYIYKNLRYKLDYTPLKINANANARHSSSENTYTSDTELIRDRNAYSIGVTLTYPLFDKKEELEREKDQIQIKQKLIDEVSKFLRLREEIRELKEEIKLLYLLETRAKARKLTGSDSFDNWLSVLKDIKKNKEDLKIKEIEFLQQKRTIFTYVKSNAHNRLEELLR